MDRILWLTLSTVGLLVALLPSRAIACSVCTNPTFTAREADVKASAAPQRVRLELGARIGAARAGGVALQDRRFDLVYTLLPIPRLELSLDVPMLARTIRSPERTTFDVVPGDLEIGATGAIWSWRAQRSDATILDERLSLHGGLKLPTAPLQRDGTEQLLPSVLQPGCSSVAPRLGVSYTMAASGWSFSAGGSVVLPIAVREGPHTSTSLRSFLTVSVRATKYLTAIAGWTTRLEPSGELRTDHTDPNSGGFVGSTVVGISVSPVETLTLGVAMYTPVAQVLGGDQRLSPTYAATVGTQF